jgi:hypothetical protein
MNLNCEDPIWQTCGAARHVWVQISNRTKQRLDQNVFIVVLPILHKVNLYPGSTIESWALGIGPVRGLNKVLAGSLAVAPVLSFLLSLAHKVEILTPCQ